MALRLTGRLICANSTEAGIVHAHLPDHIALTHAEPGCEMFEVRQGADPLVFTVSERFTDRAAFEAHQARVQASEWGRATQGIARDYQIEED
ncbi:antibiotic biosynthesis monooxygenase [Thioclava sp. F34-6]|uniref:putative quinol monooxygenase n=1 Tax=Thioclava sp. F34-6 TaxID=1973003 RepID=UPI000B53FA3E|nr:antibiotic biosynthesis monooxygenase [Thioclava sp. F34-6]OWY15452.1 antibiotic biosynthesis monooxygenase [Thioclava sp. F34-6]